MLYYRFLSKNCNIGNSSQEIEIVHSFLNYWKVKLNKLNKYVAKWQKIQFSSLSFKQIDSDETADI